MADLGSMVINLQMEFAQFKQATNKAVAELEKINKATKQTAEHMSNLDKMVGRLQRTLTAFAGVFVFREVTSAISAAVDAMIEYNSQLETSKLGIAAILMSQGEFTNSIGETYQGYQKLVAAQQVSEEIVKQLQVDNLKTIATFDQLLKAYQSTLAVSLEIGLSLKQAREYTLGMVQAAGVMGLRLDMLAEETRSLLRGTISERNTIIARNLGITPAQIKQMEGDVDAWFKFVMGRLDAFTKAGEESQKTWTGMVSNLKDAFKKLMGEGLEPLFEYAKKQMKELYDMMVTVNSETQELEVKPELLTRLNLVAEGVKVVFEVIKETAKVGVFGGLLAPLKLIEERIQKLEERAKKVKQDLEKPTFVPTVDLRMKEEMARADEGAKNAKRLLEEWVQSFAPVVEAMKQLGLVSEVMLKKQAQDAMYYLGIVRDEFKRTGKYGYDYVRALKAAKEAMEKLVGPDITDELVKNTVDLETAMRAIPFDDPDRQKKMQALIDSWLKTRKEIQAKKITPEIDPTPYEQDLRQLQSRVVAVWGDIFSEVKQKVEDEKIIIQVDDVMIQSQFSEIERVFMALKSKIESTPITVKIKSEGSVGGESGMLQGSETSFFTGGAVENATSAINELKSEIGGGIDVGINIYGIGSSRKPITEKIREIINEFGGLDKALSGMEAEINVAELQAEYNRLNRVLESTKQYPTALSQALSLAGNPMAWFQIPPDFWNQYRQQIADLTEQMRILQMKIEYEMLSGYGGSMQSGGIVPRTGYYRLHEGERVTSKSVSMGNININLPMGSSKEQAKEIAKQLALIIKYKRSGDLAEYV